MACAPSQGWSRDDSRVCAADAPAIVCVASEPDRGVEFELGGAVVLPGECAQAPKGGGRLRVHWTDEHGTIHDGHVRAPAHRRTAVVLRGDALEVDDRSRCDRTLGATARPDDE